LLSELRLHSRGLAVAPIHGDIGALRTHVTPAMWMSLQGGDQEPNRAVQDVQLIVCMGDTLTHLPSRQAVVEMFSAAAALLGVGGRLLLSYRDLSSTLTGNERFISVRSDAECIMTCFLEYETERVIVHDLVHTRVAEHWSMQVSSYPKLRLTLDWVTTNLQAVGFTIERAGPSGRLSLVVAKRT
jgi:hypothetical protein